MKRLLVVCLTTLLLFAFALTGHALSIAVDTLEFSSLEEFLEAYNAVCEGTATGELAELAGNDRGQYSIKFAELDELYLPTGVPEDYKLHKIGINYLRVFYIYLYKNDLISEEAIQRAILEQKEFHFSVFRWKLDYPMEGTLRQSGVTEKDLIGGVYLFEKPNSLTWGVEKTIMHVYMPLSLSNAKGKDLVKYATVDAVDIETGERTPYSPPVLHDCTNKWYNRVPNWLHWILRYILFGWAWMCC